MSAIDNPSFVASEFGTDLFGGSCAQLRLECDRLRQSDVGAAKRPDCAVRATESTASDAEKMTITPNRDRAEQIARVKCGADGRQARLVRTSLAATRMTARAFPFRSARVTTPGDGTPAARNASTAAATSPAYTGPASRRPPRATTSASSRRMSAGARPGGTYSSPARA